MKFSPLRVTLPGRYLAQVTAAKFRPDKNDIEIEFSEADSGLEICRDWLSPKAPGIAVAKLHRLRFCPREVREPEVNDPERELVGLQVWLHVGEREGTPGRNGEPRKFLCVGQQDDDGETILFGYEQVCDGDPLSSRHDDPDAPIGGIAGGGSGIPF